MGLSPMWSAIRHLFKRTGVEVRFSAVPCTANFWIEYSKGVIETDMSGRVTSSL